MVVRGGVTKKPLTLYYHDGLECFRFLFGNPLFSNHMDFIPRCEYTSNDKMERLYNDIMTGDNAWKLQVRSLLKKANSFANDMLYL